MESTKPTITVSARVKAPVERVWAAWTNPNEITQWNAASEDWHSPRAENDVRSGGKFNIRMESKDGQHGFDFEGEYDDVEQHKSIHYTMGDGRKVYIHFSDHGNETVVDETFEAESQNSLELQRDGWQAIMNNFKEYVERSQEDK